MIVHDVTPILNVSDMDASFAWFAKLGWNTSTFASFEDETQDKGCWMSWWVEDVDAAYAECVKLGIEVTWPPTDMPWNVREMHVRHPDGHVFRIGKGLKEE